MWIHEGWATYLECLFVEYMYGHADYLAYVNAEKNKVRNTEPIVSRGRRFGPYGFALTLPADSKERQAWVEFSIDNVDLRLVDLLRAAITPPTAIIELIVSDAPDVTEFETPELVLRDVSWDAGAITGKLMAEDVFSQSFPSRAATYDPPQFAGLFA